MSHLESVFLWFLSRKSKKKKAGDGAAEKVEEASEHR